MTSARQRFEALTFSGVSVKDAADQIGVPVHVAKRWCFNRRPSAAQRRRTRG